MRTIALGRSELVALVDDDDYAAVMDAGPWYLMKRDERLYYAQQGPRARPRRFLHSFLTGYELTDHVNHDGLDNTRTNLRKATATQNHGNQRPRAGCSSRYKGVYWSRQARKWRAEISIARKRNHLGMFTDERAAATAYDNAARILYGEFACTNFSEEAAA